MSGFSDEMYVSLKDKKRLEFFNEWEHRYTDERYVVGHRMHVTSDREIILSLGFDDPQGSIRDEALGLLEGLSSHLQRAVEIHHLFGRHMLEQTPELRIMDSLNYGVIFLDRLGRPGYHNGVAEQIRSDQISERGDGLRLSSASLRARDGQSQNQLEAMIHACRQRDSRLEQPAGGWVSVKRDDAGPDYSLLVIPMPEVNSIHLFSNPRVLILISDPEKGREDIGAALKQLYGLTGSEVNVRLSLAAGKDTSSIADELLVSRQAVRFHLKNIFAKTRVKRQGELIRLPLRLPMVPFEMR